MKSIDQREKELLQAVKEIKESEKRIEVEEKQILQMEREITQKLKQKPWQAFFLEPGVTFKEIHFLRLSFLKKLSKHKLLYGIIGTIAVVLVWRGIWHTVDEIPILSYSLVSLIVGVIIIWILKKYTDIK